MARCRVSAKIVARCLTMLLVLGAASATCASVIFTTLNHDSLTVGDRIEFCVGLVVAKGATVVPPATDQGFGALVVKDWLTDKQEHPGADSITFKYLLTTYTVDTCSIPALTFQVSAGGKVDTLATKPIRLRVASVVPSDTVDIKDLRPQQHAGKPSYWWVWTLAVLLLLAAAIWLALRLFGKKSKVNAGPPPLPPYEEAIEALKQLEAKTYLTKGMVREYVFELSDIFKRYIERRFDVNAAEFTTEQIVDWIRAASLERTIKAGAEWFFSATDPVKFAKLTPDDESVERFLKEVRLFLESTRPSAQPTQPPQEGKNAAA